MSDTILNTDTAIFDTAEQTISDTELRDMCFRYDIEEGSWPPVGLSLLLESPLAEADLIRLCQILPEFGLIDVLGIIIHDSTRSEAVHLTALSEFFDCVEYDDEIENIEFFEEIANTSKSEAVRVLATNCAADLEAALDDSYEDEDDYFDEDDLDNEDEVDDELILDETEEGK